MLSNKRVEELRELFGLEGAGYWVKGFAEAIDKFTEAMLTIRRAQIMAHRIDWLVSGDDGPDTFLERLEKDLMALEKA